VPKIRSNLTSASRSVTIIKGWVCLKHGTELGPQNAKFKICTVSYCLQPVPHVVSKTRSGPNPEYTAPLRTQNFRVALQTFYPTKIMQRHNFRL